jgi:hypothetical protein
MRCEQIAGRFTRPVFLAAMDGGLSRPSMASEALGLLPGGHAENAGAFFGEFGDGERRQQRDALPHARGASSIGTLTRAASGR